MQCPECDKHISPKTSVCTCGFVPPPPAALAPEQKRAPERAPDPVYPVESPGYFAFREAAQRLGLANDEGLMRNRGREPGCDDEAMPA